MCNSEQQDIPHTYFESRETCFHDLGLARATFTNINTTEDEYEQMEKTLGLMYLHCQEEIQTLVLSTLDEASMRKMHFIQRWALQHDSYSVGY